MKKVLIVLVAAMFLFLSFSAAVAAPAAKKSAAEAPANNDMAGQIGIGTDGDGVGIRYWLDEKLAADGNVSFYFDKENTEFGIGGGVAYVLKKMNNLRFLGLAGVELNIDNYESGTYKDEETSFTVGCGLGVDFRFHEIPNLSIEAYVGRLGIHYSSTDITSNGNTTSDSYTAFATQPGVGLVVRYYFK